MASFHAPKGLLSLRFFEYLFVKYCLSTHIFHVLLRWLFSIILPLKISFKLVETADHIINNFIFLITVFNILILIEYAIILFLPKNWVLSLIRFLKVRIFFLIHVLNLCSLYGLKLIYVKISAFLFFLFSEYIVLADWMLLIIIL